MVFSLFRLNLGSLARKVLSIFQNDCVQQYQEALALHSSRMRYQPSPGVLGQGILG